MKPTTISRPGWMAAAFLAAAFAGLVAVQAQDAGPAAPEAEPNPVVARVNGVDITEADLRLAAQDFRETLAQLPPEQRLPALLDGIIDIRLMARAAEAANLTDDEEAARRVAFMRDRALRAEYLKVEVFDAITDETIQTRYDTQIAAFEPQEEIRASHILVETEDEAKAIIALLDGGGDFAAIAKEKSTDLGSGANGGDLDFFGHGRMVAAFETAAFALEVGAYTKVKSDFGWHVIKLVEKRMSSPPTLDQLGGQLREEVAKELFLAAVAKLRATAEIEVVAPEPAPGTGAAPAPAEPAPAP